MPDTRRLAIVVADFDNGGVERHMVNLARGAAGQVTVDFLSCDDGGYLTQLPDAVQRRSLDRADRLQSLVTYLREYEPSVLLSAKEPDDALVLAARDRAGSAARVALLAVTNVAVKTGARSLPVRWWQRRGWRRRCRAADILLAVSRGVAHDLARVCGVNRERIRVLPNPTITPELEALAQRGPDHPWLEPGAGPLVVGLGRLGRIKDFATLIRAFALLRQGRAVRLAILGEGRQRRRLERLVARLGLQRDVLMPGFVENPYIWLARANLFVLSSRREGMPNALIEALAVGTPVVATDCPSGPRELLTEGELGALVPVGDPRAMARAMEAALASPPDPDRLRRAVEPYRMEASAAAYLAALGLVRGVTA